MKFGLLSLGNLFKTNNISVPPTVVSDDLVVLYPKPNERTKSIIQRVPLTSKVLFLYKLQRGISKEWKSWAWEMMENGLDTPGIIQLAGENLNMNPFEFSSLVSNIINELGIDITNDDVYYQYALFIAHQVINSELTAEKGFEVLAQAATETDYHDAFVKFYYLEEDADLLRNNLPGFYGDGNMRKDNIEEWMHLYFEKLIKRNKV